MLFLGEIFHAFISFLQVLLINYNTTIYRFRSTIYQAFSLILRDLYRIFIFKVQFVNYVKKWNQFS